MPKALTVEEVSGNMKICIYGPQGAGKTTLAATAQDCPEMRDVLFLDCEGGLMSVASRGDLAFERVASVQDLETVFWKIQRREEEYVRFKTVVIDSLTELQAISLENVAREAIELERRRGGRVTRSLDEPHLKDYARSTNELRRVLRWMKTLPVNLIVTALAKNVYPPRKEGQPPVEDAAPVEVRPDLTERLAVAVMGMVDFVWYLCVNSVKDEGQEAPRTERLLLTSDYGPYRAKTRGALFARHIGQVVKDPVLPALFNAFIETEGKEGRDVG